MTSNKNGVHANDGGRITVLNLVFVVFLLALPGAALLLERVDLRWVGAYIIGINLITYAIYAVDKRHARANQWRVPEMTLHLLELLGGWPGAFLAQRRFRHKCNKGSYQFVFWMIVLTYQFAAVDALQNWRVSRTALKWLQTTSHDRR